MKLSSWLLALALVGTPQTAGPPIDATVLWDRDRLDRQWESLDGARSRAGTLGLAPGATLGRAVGQVQVTPFPSYVALPSWNAHAPGGTGLRFAMRVRTAATDSWSPWLEVGNWGDALPTVSPRATEGPGVKVDIDTLLADPPVVAYQWRVEMMRVLDDGPSPTLSRLSVCLTGRPHAGATPQELAELAPEPAAIALPAPFHGQVTSNPALTGRICSPCTVSSALGAFGVDLPTETVAADLYDPEHDLYGVWPRAIQGAYEHGVPGYVTRIRSWTELRHHLEAGHVVGASIRFRRGVLAHPPYPETPGHLILLHGLTASGDIVTEDSYRSRDGHGLVWPKEDLAIAWFGSGGVAYLFERPSAGR